jgi:hypothetical protein
MKNVTIFPPKMEAIGQALDLFGEKRVKTGEWNEPIIVSGLTADEAAYAGKFFNEMGCEVRQVQEINSRSEAVSRDIHAFA